jgi:hypothetical protein
VILFIVLGGYAFFLQSKLTIEVGSNTIASLTYRVGSSHTRSRPKGCDLFNRKRSKDLSEVKASRARPFGSWLQRYPQATINPEHACKCQLHRKCIANAAVVMTRRLIDDGQAERAKLVALATEEELALLKRTQKLAEEVRRELLLIRRH